MLEDKKKILLVLLPFYMHNIPVDGQGIANRSYLLTIVAFILPVFPSLSEGIPLDLFPLLPQITT